MEDALKKLPTHVGARIRHYRNLQSLRVTDLAKLAGLTSGYLSLIENGRTNITLATLTALAQALGVSEQDLLPSEDSREREELLHDINRSLDDLPLSALRSLAALLSCMRPEHQDKTPANE